MNRARQTPCKKNTYPMKTKTHKIKIQLGTLLLVLLFAGTASAQGFLKTSNQEIVNENGEPVLLRGMGLGGWMLQEGYMLQTSDFANAQHEIRSLIEELIGPANTDSFYEAWHANHVTKADIDSLASWGFNSVRLPMHYNLFTLPIEEEPEEGEHTWLEKGFRMTDSVVKWCAHNEMYVILDLHAAPGGQGKDEGISDYDPSKPSLWESKLNRDKTVALWKKLAARYADEPWVAGYDLINETNWELPGNTLLKALYQEITDSIRTVDTNHILFIEGNWFANDFTGLTPPWDGNMVYSPHKYWSFNDQATIQWVLDIRETYNVPLYFGEAGENSNVWFRDAIRLFEDYNIGWAWWPMKKIESISGPLSVIKTPEYQVLLDYWSGNGEKPEAGFATDALMETADLLKIENCRYQKDVIDAMFRQVNGDEPMPFNIHGIPGVIYASDFDMGLPGRAYFDTDIANYHVSTGNYTAWNRGWSYRNDGVDIEPSFDNINSNGYNVGFVAQGEWMQYTVNVLENAAYDVRVRVASESSGGAFHFSMADADICETIQVPATGGWQEWQAVTIPDLILTGEDKHLRFAIDQKEFNVGSFEFIAKGPTTAIPTTCVSAFTADEHTIRLNINKPLSGPLPPSPANFQLYVNQAETAISNVSLDQNTRVIVIETTHAFKSSETITLSYTGNDITAKDGTKLEAFAGLEVQNRVAIVHAIPGKVEAEDFFDQSGIQLEDCSDEGGGQNIGYLDAGDYCDYLIQVGENGTYRVDYRTASESAGGGLKLQLVDASGNPTDLHSIGFPSTGGWQNWETTSKNVILPSGQHHLRLLITEPLFNVNWFQFTFLTSTDDPSQRHWSVYPNPAGNFIVIEGASEQYGSLEVFIHDQLGRLVLHANLNGSVRQKQHIDLSGEPSGIYLLTIRSEVGVLLREKIIKTNL